MCGGGMWRIDDQKGGWMDRWMCTESLGSLRWRGRLTSASHWYHRLNWCDTSSSSLHLSLSVGILWPSLLLHQAAAELFLHINRRQYFVLCSSSLHASSPLFSSSILAVSNFSSRTIPCFFTHFIYICPSILLSSFSDLKVHQLPALFDTRCWLDASTVSQ